MGKWKCSALSINNPDWVVNGGLYQTVTTSLTTPTAQLTWLSYNNDTPLIFNSNITYQFITKITNFNTNELTSPYTLTITPPFGSPKIFTPSSYFNGSGYYYIYGAPTTTISNSQFIKYNTNLRTMNTNSGINEFIFNDTINFFINGYSNFRVLNYISSDALDVINDGDGWSYIDNKLQYKSYKSLLPATPDPVYNYQPNKPYIAFEISTSFFDLSFDYENVPSGNGKGFDIYTSKTITPFSTSIDFNNSSDFTTLLQHDTNTTKYEVFNQIGSCWLYLVPRSHSNLSETSVENITNIQTSSKYHSGNNKIYQYNPNTLSLQGISNVGYQAVIGKYNEKTKKGTKAKIGNGEFLSGIWENGVWNSGWREDSTVNEFYILSDFYSEQKDKVWSFILKGKISNINDKYQIGDKVSIGNIVAIDINDNRVLLKKYFNIVDLGIDENNISFVKVQFEMEFPLRRIIKDSDNHRILVSKNVWLHGAFLNGYFKGVWNDGIYKGLPFLTKMEDSQWIDGIFEGGHFKNTIKYGNFDLIDTTKDNIALTFSTEPSNIIVEGDSINITNDYFNNTELNIISIRDGLYYLDFKTLDIPSISLPLAQTGGTYSLNINSGLIQNFDFKSLNKSTIKSTNDLTNNVFQYNSWIDVQYDNNSAVNIGRPSTLLNEYSETYYSLNNLYGYPTKDVLSSKSIFRDSFSLDERQYNLGYKFKPYYDYVGASSNFDEYFTNKTDLFLNQGWTYSNIENDLMPGTITFSTSKDQENGLIVGKELKVDSWGKGGILNLASTDSSIQDRTNTSIEKGRYTLIEFELLTYSATYTTHSESISYYQYGVSVETEPNGQTQAVPVYYKTKEYIESPVLHFDNLNIITRTNSYHDNTNNVDLVVNELKYATYLPIYENVNHLETKSLKKQEYFYNKINLALNLRGSGIDNDLTGYEGIYPSSIILDNLKLYEVDMIPFFQYFKNDNINSTVQLPFGGVAPYIDYTLYDDTLLKDKTYGVSDISISETYDSIKNGNEEDLFP